MGSKRYANTSTRRNANKSSTNDNPSEIHVSSDTSLSPCSRVSAANLLTPVNRSATPGPNFARASASPRSSAANTGVCPASSICEPCVSAWISA